MLVTGISSYVVRYVGIFYFWPGERHGMGNSSEFVWIEMVQEEKNGAREIDCPFSTHSLLFFQNQNWNFLFHLWRSVIMSFEIIKTSHIKLYRCVCIDSGDCRGLPKGLRSKRMDILRGNLSKKSQSVFTEVSKKITENSEWWTEDRDLNLNPKFPVKHLWEKKPFFCY